VWLPQNYTASSGHYGTLNAKIQQENEEQLFEDYFIKIVTTKSQSEENTYVL
jgi:hypothetical protein